MVWAWGLQLAVMTLHALLAPYLMDQLLLSCFLEPHQGLFLHATEGASEILSSTPTIPLFTEGGLATLPLP